MKFRQIQEVGSVLYLTFMLLSLNNIFLLINFSENYVKVITPVSIVLVLCVIVATIA